MLRVNKDADYGVMLMCHFATHDDQLFAASELARQVHLPQPTVTKILKILTRAGFLSSNRGLKGGYRLKRPAGQITVAEVVTAISGPIAVTSCCEHGPGCEHVGVCPTQENWRIVDDAVRKALGSVTLLEMSRPNSLRATAVTNRVSSNLNTKENML